MTGWTVEEVVAHTDKNVDILDVFVFFCCCLLDYYYYNFGFRTIFPFFQYPFFFHVPISAQPFLSSIQINSWLDSPILVLVKLGSDSVSQGNRYILLVSAP